MIENALQVVRAAAEPARSSSVIVSSSKYLVIGIPEGVSDVQDLLIEVYDRHGKRRDGSDFHAITHKDDKWWWYTNEWGSNGRFFHGQSVRVVGQPTIGKTVYVPGKGHTHDFSPHLYEIRSSMPGAVVFDGYARVTIEAGDFDSTLSLLINKASTYVPSLAKYGVNTNVDRARMFLYLPTLYGSPKVTAKSVPELAQKAAATSSLLMEGVNAFVHLANRFTEQAGYQAFKLIQE